jgi:hypothetical protein
MFVFDLLYFILKIIVFILIIYGVQYGWDTIKNTYTKPVTKDLVNSQLKKYKEMVDEIYNHTKEETVPEVLFNTDEDKQQMNDDLLSFINTQTNAYTI